MSCKGNVESVQLREDVPLSFSPLNHIAMACDRELIFYPFSSGTREVDISEIMRKRAQKGYGLDIQKNIEIVTQEHNTELVRTWEWLADTHNVLKCNLFQNRITPVGFQRYGAALKGLLPFLCHSDDAPAMDGCKSESFEAIEHALPVYRVYHSQPRVKAIAMAGWYDTLLEQTPAKQPVKQEKGLRGLGQPKETVLEQRAGKFASQHSIESQNLEIALWNLERQGEFEKAAFVALVHLKLERSVEALSKKPELGMVGFALSGWADVVRRNQKTQGKRALLPKLPPQLASYHHYVRACFSLITSALDQADPSEESSLMPLLDTPGGLNLRERVALACRFLSDDQLKTFILECVEEVLGEGELDGLALVGAHEDGVKLMQQYVNRTGDIQTIAIIGCFPRNVWPEAYNKKEANQKSAITEEQGEVIVDMRLENWLMAYKELLNRWRMWNQRAQFNVDKRLLEAQFQPCLEEGDIQYKQAPPMLTLGCSSCMRPLERLPTAKTVEHERKNRNKQNRQKQTVNPSSQRRTHGCPDAECSMALPRCSICYYLLDSAKPPPLLFKSLGASYYKDSDSKEDMLQMSRRAMGGIQGNPDDPANKKNTKPLTQNEEKEQRRQQAQEKRVALEREMAKREELNRQRADRAAKGQPPLEKLEKEVARYIKLDKKREVLRDAVASNPFQNWITWCQNCRHGGHAQHLMMWFSTHQRCPVPDCGCLCANMDGNMHQTIESQQLQYTEIGPYLLEKRAAVKKKQTLQFQEQAQKEKEEQAARNAAFDRLHEQADSDSDDDVALEQAVGKEAALQAKGRAKLQRVQTPAKARARQRVRAKAEAKQTAEAERKKAEVEVARTSFGVERLPVVTVTSGAEREEDFDEEGDDMEEEAAAFSQQDAEQVDDNDDQ